ncbi:Transcription factor [Penicillium occitanis (nom. inval.)]|nr:Transcription factor [Penicillium occitanis (nom. inval.)]PCH00571.1 hypothetical protein PENOC_052410 [Penicillium occitanis (nom. inval.)]
MNLSPMLLLEEATIDISPGISLPIPSTTPSAYFENVPSAVSSPFDFSLPSSIETEDQLPSILSTEMQVVDNTTVAPPIQAQLIMAQIKSAAFNHFHLAGPLLHVPSFTAENKSTLLISALSNLSMWMQDAYRHHLIPDEINQQLTQALVVRTTEETLTSKPGTDNPLQTLQALAITLIYAISASTSTLDWAAQWTDIAVSTFRRLGILNDQWLAEDQGRLAEERWVQVEQVKRLVFTVLRIDTYLCIILDRPPALRYQEIRLSLPVSDELWRAETREACTRLHWYEPAGRSRSAFSTMMRDRLETQGFMTGYLRMPRLSLEDNHFSLCAFMSEIWGICRETHEEHHLSYRSSQVNRTADRVCTWKGYLQDWRAQIEQTDDLENALFSEPSGHAQSADGREAVYHAVQLKRIYEHQSTFYKSSDHRLSNVLGPAGLLASAVVLCFYSTKISNVTTECSAADSDEAVVAPEKKI